MRKRIPTVHTRQIIGALGRRHTIALAPGLIAVGLMLVWAVHNGGYDADTWYWGALVLLFAALGATIAVGAPLRISRPGLLALGAFALYVAWSYLSISWAQSPGDALQGSNRALLYLLIFGLTLALPWTPEAALIALLTFVVGVGVVEVVLLIRLASADHVARLVIGGRLAAPTGYFNATAALFTVEAVTATALATLRRLPAALQGLLIAFACAGLQLALIVQSRGWLFTLPLVALVAIVLVPDRLRVAAASVLPIVGTLAPLRSLLNVFKSSSSHGLAHAAVHAGTEALLICAALFVAGTLIAYAEKLLGPRQLRPGHRRALGSAMAAVALIVPSAAGIAATHGHPFHFIAREWHGFSHQQTAYSSGSHFADVGSGRYDFWRVALDGFAAHPIGGLGQDNFANYYLKHRRTAEEPQWTHSLELRLLTHTGIVGLLLFTSFLGAALAAALRTRRTAGTQLARAIAAASLLPLVVWLIHGSIDWFWEIPALSGPALGFLGMAAALASPQRATVADSRQPWAMLPRASAIAAGTLAFIVAFVALGFPYLSVREVSIASNIASSNPSGALRDLTRAADLNPLSADPGRLGGIIALHAGQFSQAAQRFSQAISRDSGEWFSWLGAGLASSALGNKQRAHHDFAVAASINRQQPAVTEALARVYTRHLLTPAQAFRMLVVAP